MSFTEVNLLGPSKPRVSSNVVVARDTVSHFLRFVWTTILHDGSIGGTLLWIRVLSMEKPFLANVESACQYHGVFNR